MPRTLKAVTPVGTFTRETNCDYHWVNVWDSPRAHAAVGGEHRDGVAARWQKDNGYGVTWHYNAASADKAALGKYGWDHAAKIVGTFPVSDER